MGVAVGVKVSLLIFPGVIGLWWLLARPKLLRSVAFGVLSGATGVAVYLLILAANYLGRLDQVGRFFTDIRIVSNGMLVGLLQERGNQTYLEWLIDTVSHPVLTGVYSLILLAPILLLFWLPVARSRSSRSALAAFVVGAAAYQYAIVYRPSVPLYCEGALYVLVAVMALCHLTGFPVSVCVGPLKGEMRWSLLGAGALLAVIAWYTPARVTNVVDFGPYSDEQHALDAALASHPGRVIIVPPSEGWLIDPVGVAITRGSTTIYSRSFASNALWGDYLDKHAILDPFRQEPLDLAGASVLVWAFPAGRPDLTRDQALATLGDLSKLSYDGFTPVAEIPSINRTIVIMTRELPRQRP
jgi:hypothetical protein